MDYRVQFHHLKLCYRYIYNIHHGIYTMRNDVNEDRIEIIKKLKTDNVYYTTLRKKLRLIMNRFHDLDWENDESNDLLMKNNYDYEHVLKKAMGIEDKTIAKKAYLCICSNLSTKRRSNSIENGLEAYKTNNWFNIFEEEKFIAIKDRLLYHVRDSASPIHQKSLTCLKILIDHNPNLVILEEFPVKQVELEFELTSDEM